ncbi:MAG: phosphotransferase, partial [Candidatus Nanohaloarchaea archaeon]|nr:phosphotransferase [Candidatus Nanohaloarchaea archaeon]
IIQEVVGHSSPTTKTVQGIYGDFQEKFDSEIHMLTDADIDSLKEVNRKVGEAVEKFRKEEIVMVPGGGGEYGEIVIPSDEGERKRIEERREDELECRYTGEQKSLSSF